MSARARVASDASRVYVGSKVPPKPVTDPSETIYPKFYISDLVTEDQRGGE
jgi:hypothetical protein